MNKSQKLKEPQNQLGLHNLAYDAEATRAGQGITAEVGKGRGYSLST